MARGPTVKTGGGAKTGTHSATTGYEAELWRMADALRGSMDAAEYGRGNTCTLHRRPEKNRRRKTQCGANRRFADPFYTDRSTRFWRHLNRWRTFGQRIGVTRDMCPADSSRQRTSGQKGLGGVEE